MIRISLCMIVKNEQAVLARALDSICDAVDEIIIVDTGSNDSTKQIALQYTPQVFDFEWTDDFSAARNFSFSKASMDYCMWLDADDVLLEPDRNALLQLKKTLEPDVGVVMMKYHTAFDENGLPSFSYYRERLLNNSMGFVWQGAVHEAISPSGKIIYSNIAITHRKLRSSDPDRNLRIFEKQLANGRPLSAREQFYYARELYYHQQYDKSARVLETFLAGEDGWVENQIEACRLLAYCRYQLGNDNSALHALLYSLEFDVPRAEVCCDIGKHFLDRARYKQAAFWYQRALHCTRNDTSGAFISTDCYGYLPCIQLCVCYSKMGEQQLAYRYNQKAGTFKPDDRSYLYNKAYFESLSADAKS